MDNQTTIFEMLYPNFKIKKPLRLITFFSGYDSQALALKYLGIDFELYKTCEWAVKSIQALKDLHFGEDTTDYSKDLDITEVKEYLYNKGISQNYNEPMSREQINRLNEKQVRKIYNNIKATNNLVNIQQVKGDDLCITDPDKFTYLLTYSFPCQDLSLAGKGKGMSDTSTRSGMLWEVERIIKECKIKPDILLMENVPQVHSQDNIDDFYKWQLSLEEMGYKNYWQDLIATDYGIPQTRNRCFMISILGDYNYTFPKAIPLELKLKDLLEDQVDEKYYLSCKKINSMINTSFNQYKLENRLQDLEGSIDTLTCSTGERTPHVIPDKSSVKKVNLMCNDLLQQNKVKENDTILTNFITRRIKEDDIIQNNNITPTLTTSATEIGVVVMNKSIRKYGIFDTKEKTHQAGSVYDENFCSPTIDTATGGYRQPMIEIKNNNCIGTYDYARSDNFMGGKDRFHLSKDVMGTLLTTQKEGIVNSDLRIRRLTCRECFRLMGVKDQDFDKVAKNQSDSSLYHLAGDSIVVNVLMAIFKELL